jgi:hypothetical protein
MRTLDFEKSFSHKHFVFKFIVQIYDADINADINSSINFKKTYKNGN